MNKSSIDLQIIAQFVPPYMSLPNGIFKIYHPNYIFHLHLCCNRDLIYEALVIHLNISYVWWWLYFLQAWSRASCSCKSASPWWRWWCVWVEAWLLLGVSDVSSFYAKPCTPKIFWGFAPPKTSLRILSGMRVLNFRNELWNVSNLICLPCGWSI